MARTEKYRVNANVQGLTKGETVEINPKDPHWSPLIEKGYLVEHVDDQEPEYGSTDE